MSRPLSCGTCCRRAWRATRAPLYDASRRTGARSRRPSPSGTSTPRCSAVLAACSCSAAARAALHTQTKVPHRVPCRSSTPAASCAPRCPAPSAKTKAAVTAPQLAQRPTGLQARPPRHHARPRLPSLRCTWTMASSTSRWCWPRSTQGASRAPRATTLQHASFQRPRCLHGGSAGGRQRACPCAARTRPQQGRLPAARHQLAGGARGPRAGDGPARPPGGGTRRRRRHRRRRHFLPGAPPSAHPGAAPGRRRVVADAPAAAHRRSGAQRAADRSSKLQLRDAHVGEHRRAGVRVRHGPGARQPHPVVAAPHAAPPGELFRRLPPGPRIASPLPRCRTQLCAAGSLRRAQNPAQA